MEIEKIRTAVKILEEFLKDRDQMEIEDAVALVPNEAVRPEIITVRKEGERIVLLRPRLDMPNGSPCRYAFLMWAGGLHSTAWKICFTISPSIELNSRTFAIACGCCRVEKYGLPVPEGAEEKAWHNDLRATFTRQLLETCREHGIDTLFVRHADYWEKNYTGLSSIRFVEADQHREVLKKHCSSDSVERALSFKGR